MEKMPILPSISRQTSFKKDPAIVPTRQSLSKMLLQYLYNSFLISSGYFRGPYLVATNDLNRTKTLCVCVDISDDCLVVHPGHVTSILHRHLQSHTVFIISICTADYNCLKQYPILCPFLASMMAYYL